MEDFPFQLEFIVHASSIEAKHNLMEILEPEIQNQQFERSRVILEPNAETETSFKIKIHSKDRASLLANVGSFLRWFEFIERLEKEVVKKKE